MHNLFRALTISESVNAEAQINQLSKTYKRFEDMQNGITWRLARNPECGVLIDNNYRLVNFEQNVDEIVAICVLYLQVDDNTIEIYSVKVETKI